MRFTEDKCKLFRNADSTCDIYVSAYTFVDVEFYFQGGNAPILEIEYLTNQNSRPVKQSFALVGGVTGKYNVATGDIIAEFCDVNEMDSMFGLKIAHVFKKSRDKLYVGKNMRLSLNETLLKNNVSSLDSNYIYTDAYGDKHGFKDTYYYVDETKTKRSILSKSSIVVDLNGELSYTTSGKKYKVYQEQHTSTGLKAITKIEGFKYAEYLEQRVEEYKQLENQKQTYENALKSMVLVNKNNGKIEYWLENFLTKTVMYGL